MHVQDVPASAGLSAHGHATPDEMLLGRHNFVVVGVPKRAAKEFHVVELHLVRQPRRILKEPPLQVLHHFFAATVLTLQCKKDNVGIETAASSSAFPASNADVQ